MAPSQEQRPPNEKEKKREFIRFLGIASTVGINIVVSTVIGFAIGYFLIDMYLFPKIFSFNTFPWFTIIFLILGIASGFKYLFKIAGKMERNEDPDVRD
jgi:F0F1-type ATP synthase assembly protein I